MKKNVRLFTCEVRWNAWENTGKWLQSVRYGKVIGWVAKTERGYNAHVVKGKSKAFSRRSMRSAMLFVEKGCGVIRVETKDGHCFVDKKVCT